MTVCECGKKYVSPKMYEEHRVKVHVFKEPEPVDETVTVRFAKPVEIIINGIAYRGSEIKAPNIQLASEIVRIAREGYGREILII